MELLLREDVPDLGKAGQIVKVKSGYARNFLLPKNLAIDVNEENLRVVQKEAKRRESLEKKRVDELKGIAAKLAEATCTIEAKAADGGHLYGSISPAIIAQALSKMGFPVEESAVRLETPIKDKGTYPVRLHLHAEVEVTTHIVVVEEAAK